MSEAFFRCERCGYPMDEDGQRLVCARCDKPKHTAIIFGPYSTNVLDWVNKPGLVTPDGKQVQVKRSGNDFLIIVGERRYETASNIAASRILNDHETGIVS